MRMNTSDRPIEWITNRRYLGAVIADNDTFTASTPIKGRLQWKPARPAPYYSFINRILQAYDVLTSKANALYYYEDFNSCK